MLYRYMTREIGGVLLIAAPSLCLLIGLLQAMRLAPLLAGAEIGAGESLELVGLLLVPLITIALPAATVISVLMALGRLESNGELLAMRAAGAGPTRLAAAPAFLCALVALTTGVCSLLAEPAAYDALHGRLGGLLSRATLGRIRSDVITELSPGLTVLGHRLEGNRLGRVFIEDRREDQSVQLFSSTASLAPHPSRTELGLVLEDGALYRRSPDGTLTRASFSRLEAVFDLDDSARDLSAIVPHQLGKSPSELLAESARGGPEARPAQILLHRRLAAAPGALGLCMLTILFGLWRPASGRPVAVILGALLLLGYHLTFRAGEAAVEARLLPPFLGAWLGVASCWAAVLIVLVISRARRLRTRGVCLSPNEGPSKLPVEDP